MSESQYKSARDLIDKKGYKQAGTLSADEWEVAGLYLAFAFEKVSDMSDNKDSKDSRKRPRERSHGRSSHGDRRNSGSSTKRTKRGKDISSIVVISSFTISLSLPFYNYNFRCIHGYNIFF